MFSDPIIRSLATAAAPPLREWVNANAEEVEGVVDAVVTAAPKPMKLIALDKGFYEVSEEPIRVRRRTGRTWSARLGSHAFTEWEAYGIADPYPMVASHPTFAGLKERLARYLSDRDAGTLGLWGRYIGNDDRRPAPVVGTPKPLVKA